MIRSFADKETERVWCGLVSRRFPPAIQPTALRKLRQLAAVSQPLEMRQPPGNRFEQLKGFDPPRYSVRVNDQWRVTFRWVDGGAEDVRIEDYHRG
jgi:proteic killer suppression protein